LAEQKEVGLIGKISGMRKVWNERRGKQVVKSLEKRGFKSVYFETAEEAKKHVISLIPEGSTVGFGGSATLRQMGLIDYFKAHFKDIHDNWEEEISREENIRIWHGFQHADVFVSGTNAVTLDGRLINSDGTGNRVSSMIFGPKRVIVIIGVNKIVKDIDEGISRVRQIASLNYLRGTIMNHKGENNEPPCAKDGKCRDCYPPLRKCRITTIMEGVPGATPDYHVIVVGEELGY
jgi:hypothetical protein